MIIAKKSFIITSGGVISVLLLFSLGVTYVRLNFGPYLLADPGISKEELKKGFIAAISDGKTVADTVNF